VFTGREDEVDGRRVLGGVEREHLRGLDREELCAVRAKVRGTAATGYQLARRVVQETQIFRPTTTPERPRVVNSLMQVKGTALESRIKNAVSRVHVTTAG
jgi:hypothetical protein